MVRLFESVRLSSPTPSRLLGVSLTLQLSLWLAERLGLFPMWYKGWPPLIAVAIAGLTLLLLLVWYVASIFVCWHFRFTSRSLLLLTVFLALPCSWLRAEIEAARKQATKQYEARATVRTLGGEMKWSSSILRSDAWLYNILGADYFASPTSLSLEGNVRDNDLQVLATLDTLRDFTISSDQITDTGLQYVGQLTQVERLHIHAAQVTDAGLSYLEGLPRLHDLYLCKTEVSGKGFEHLKALSSLRLLELTDTQVTDDGLEHLAAMDQLSLVNLSGTRVTADGLKRLQEKLPNCRVVR